MPTCVTCGNTSESIYRVSHQDREYVFDSIECLAAALAPSCEVCGLRILGHGLEISGRLFCCTQCARRVGLNRPVKRSERQTDHAVLVADPSSQSDGDQG